MSKSLVKAMRAADFSIRRLAQHHLVASGIVGPTATHGWILIYLNENKDKPIYQKMLEKEFNMKKSSMSAILSLMEKKELIKRTVDPNDSRKNYLTVTSKGLEQVEKIRAVMHKCEQQVTAGFSEEEQEVLREYMLRIVANCKKGVKQ